MTTQTATTEPVLDMVSTLGPWGPYWGTFLGNPSSLAYEAADRTVYTPIFIPVTTTLKRFFWANGTTVTGATNVRMAFYTDAGFKPGIRLTAANTTQATVSVIQYLDTTDITIPPGLYWIALSCSNATTHFMVTSNPDQDFRSTFRFQEAIATPPATATPVEAAGTSTYLIGFSTQTAP